MSRLSEDIQTLYSGYSEREQKLIKYSLQCITGEASKLFILFIIFGILHLWIPFLICFAVLSSIRMFSGGIHFNHYWSCLGFTLCIYLIICWFLPNYVILSDYIHKIICLVSLLVITILSPIPSIKRPQPSEKRKRLYRFLSVTIAVGWVVVSFSIRISTTAHLIEYAICFQSIQLFVAYIQKNLRKETVINHEKQNYEAGCQRT